MMEEYNPDEWSESSIADHKEKMIELLTRDLTSEYGNLFSSNANISVADNKAWRWFNQFKNDPQNKALLARAIFCFGEIANDAGNTNYLDAWHPKYYLYDWDKIKTSEAFRLFCDFVERENPSSLSSVIQFNLDKNKELQKEPYSYVFVKHPEIWEYCQQGYFTWIDHGRQILLHERERNTESSSRDLIIHLLITRMKSRYDADIKVWREGFQAGINYDTNEGRFSFSDAEDPKGDFMINCEDAGKIKCIIKPYRNASNSLFVQKLIEFGWQNAFENYYQRGSSSTLGVLSEDFDSDFVRISDKLDSIINNGLRIKL
jgi:hypothetical protein